MKRLITVLTLAILFLSVVSCAPPVSEPSVEKEPPPPPKQPTEYTIETWEIGENWTYSPQVIWGDVIVGMEGERQRGKIVRQCIATCDLRSREKERVLEIPVDRIADTPAVYGGKIVFASVDRDEFEKQPPPRNADLLNWDVFLLDLKTGDMQQITSDEHAQISPRIYGETIVWLDTRHVEEGHRHRSYDIYAYDLTSEKERRLTSSTSTEGGELSISGNWVVWKDNRYVEPLVEHPPKAPDNNEIYVYDLNANREKRITTSQANDCSPAISGDTVVWVRQSDFNQANIFAYDLKYGRETQISHSSYAAHQFLPSIHGNCIVWSDARASLGNTSNDVILNGRQGQTDIYLFDLKTQQEIQLTSTEPGEILSNPVIHGDTIVYAWVSMIKLVVYAMNLDYK